MNAKPKRLAAAVAAALFLVPLAQAEESGGGMTEAELKAMLDKLSIVGLGETRQVQRLDASEAQRYPAGTSLLKLLDRLPGVHFTNSDPWGTYGWAKRLSIRGFTQNQLGFTLDRVPLGDQSYGNHNGLHLGRALISENFSVLELSQGGGSLDTASTGNLGGTLKVTSDAPDYDFRTRFDQSFGSSSFSRTYARIDTGDRGGWRAFASAVHHDADKWKGWGPQRLNQFNGKLVKEWERFTLTGFLGASRRAETDYADLSLVSAAERGFDWDNYAPDWQAAIDAAIQLCGADGTFPYVVECDDAYYLGRGLRDDDLAYITGDWTISDTAGLVTTVYRHTNEGQGHWITPYAASANVPLSMRASEYDIDRWGVLPTLTMFLGDHKLQAGFWWESNTHLFNRNFYELNRDVPPNRAAFATNPRSRVFGQRFEVDTLMFFVEDRINLMGGRMSIDLGFKGVDVDYDATRIVGTTFAEGTINARDRILPKAAMRYGFSNQFEGFVAYNENVSVFRAGISGPFATTQAAFDTFKDSLVPESSRTVEAGVRLVSDRFEGSAIIYDVLFEDRLLSIPRGSAIIGAANVFANVGSVDTRGVELAGLWRINDGLEWYNSVAFNDSEYADDYTEIRIVNGEEVPVVRRTAGRTVVDSPKLLVSSNLSWTIGDFALKFGAKHTGKRYFTYLNDGEVPSFTVAHAALVYDFGELSWAKSAKLQFNITNLFDREYFETIGSNGFLVSYNPAGYAATLQTGAERQFFATLSFTF